MRIKEQKQKCHFSLIIINITSSQEITDLSSDKLNGTNLVGSALQSSRLLYMEYKII